MPSPMPTHMLARHERADGYRSLIEPVRPFWPLVISCLAIILFLVIAGRVMAGSPTWTHGELAVDQLLSRGHVPALDAITLTIRAVLEPLPGLLIVAVVSIGVFLKTRDRIVSLTFVLVVAGGWLSSELIKIVVQRERPDYHLLAHPLSTEANAASFPSGHVCLVTALVLGFVLLLRGRAAQKSAIAAGGVIVVVVALSRLYVGEHYPTDVLASVIYTSTAMLLFLAVWNRWLAAPVERLITPDARTSVDA